MATTVSLAADVLLSACIYRVKAQLCSPPDYTAVCSYIAQSVHATEICFGWYPPPAWQEVVCAVHWQYCLMHNCSAYDHQAPNSAVHCVVSSRYRGRGYDAMCNPVLLCLLLWFTLRIFFFCFSVISQQLCKNGGQKLCCAGRRAGPGARQGCQMSPLQRSRGRRGPAVSAAPVQSAGMPIQLMMMGSLRW